MVHGIDDTLQYSILIRLLPSASIGTIHSYKSPRAQSANACTAIPPFKLLSAEVRNIIKKMSNMQNDSGAGAGWLSCFCFGKRRRPNQVASEMVSGAKLAAAAADQCAGCVASCLEEENERTCKCPEGSMDVALSIKSADQHVKANSSFAHSVINMVGMLIGLGQLSTPYALESGGWSSAFMLVGLGAACAYTSHIIGKCLDEDSNSKTYQDVGEQAFGRKGRIVASTFMYLEIFMALVSYTISLSDNLPLVFDGAAARVELPGGLSMSKQQLLTVVAVLVSLPSLWLRDLSSISFLSLGGILMSLLIFATVAWTAAFGDVRGDHSIPALRLHNIPGVSGLYIFSYAGHIVFPCIYTAMKDPSQFTKVCITSFAIAISLYTALAVMGAMLFGAAVCSQVTLSMPPQLVATKVALWATVLTPMTKYALEFAPFAVQLERSLPSSMGSGARALIRGSVGSALLVAILILALVVPYFEHVLSLTGSLVSMGVCLILPCAFYLKVCWSRVSKPAVVLNGVLIAVGVVLGVMGTISSSKSLLHSIQSGR